jgi:subtilisin family serine protease
LLPFLWSIFLLGGFSSAPAKADSFFRPSTSPAHRKRLPAVPPAPNSVLQTVPNPAFAPGRILLRLKPEVGSAAFFRAHPFPRRFRIPQVGVEVVQVPEGQEQRICRILMAEGTVVFAEPDYYAFPQSLPGAPLLPNDPSFANEQWYLETLRAPDAWNISTGSQDVVVAVLDTGVDYNHPDLSSKLVEGYDFTADTALAQDRIGHGTHIAGLAAAASDNAVGIAGLAWNVRIAPVKVIDDGGRGPMSGVTQGILWAADHGAKILNLSFGATNENSSLSSAVQYARDKGCLLVAAAGNDYLKGNLKQYPAALPGVLAVGASTYEDQKASYSEAGDQVSVVAPGGDPDSVDDPDVRHWIYSTWLADNRDGYALLAGTSQSTALVSGLAALVWSVRPDASADAVKEIIERTAQDIGAPGKDPETGWGRVDVEAALAAATETAAATAVPGDLDGSGIVDALDLNVAILILAGVRTPTPAELQAGDVQPFPGLEGRPYGDGRIRSNDANWIMRRLLGLVSAP